VGIFALLFFRLFQIQVVEHRTFERLARENQFRIKRVVAPRGVIRDRTGKSLVDNVAEYQLFVDAAAMHNDSLLTALANDFGVDTTAAYSRWQAQRSRRRGHDPVKVLGNLSKAQLSQFEENSRRYGGAWLEARGRRRYIYGDFATHVLGYVQRCRCRAVRARRQGEAAGCGARRLPHRGLRSAASHRDSHVAGGARRSRRCHGRAHG
jgi:penicillin-binding protein 2